MGKYDLEREVATLLTEKDMTIALAESCSGGLLGHRLTSIPGSSAYFLGGVIVYSNEIKTQVLGIRYEVLRKEGAVSDTVARLMAIAVRGRFGADIGMAITGIAGPGGGTQEKKVGLVYVGLADTKKCRVCRFDLSRKSRVAVKNFSTTGALEMLKEFLKQEG